MSLRLVTTTSTTNPNRHDLHLNEAGQLSFIGQDITDTEDYSLMVAQRIECRLSMVKGEWYLDQRLGTPWREQIWRKGVTEEVIRQIIQDVVTKTPGVQSLDKLEVELDFTTRDGTVTIWATTDMQTPLTITKLDIPFIVEAPNNA